MYRDRRNQIEPTGECEMTERISQHREEVAELSRLLAAWEDFSAQVKERLIQGQGRYGQAWEGRGQAGNLREAQAEALDLAAYGFLAWLVSQQGLDNLEDGVGRGNLKKAPEAAAAHGQARAERARTAGD